MTLLGCSNSVKEVKRWIAKGADVKKTDEFGNTPLHLAHRKDIVKFSIDRGVDVHSKTNTYACSQLSCYGGDTPRAEEIIKLLIDNGADVNAKTHKINTSLMEDLLLF